MRPLRRNMAVFRRTEDDEYNVFPRERPGLDYALNWSLNGDGVTPSGDAYRLTKPSQALKLFGKPAEKVSGSPSPGGEVEEEEFDAAMQRTVAVLEDAKTLYVAEGDAPKKRLPCRVITDDLSIASSAITHIVEQMPLREPTELPVTCFVTKNGPDFAAFDIFEEDDTERLKIILAGKDANPAKLMATLQVGVDKLLNPEQV